MPSKITAPEELCKGCLQGKQHRQPFHGTASKRATEPLALTHIDLCGPMQVRSQGGARYLIMLVDDATRHKTVYLLKKKSEAAGHIKYYRAAMEAATGKKMQEIRTDRGREFVNKELGAYLKEAGIRHNLSAPYTPQQNGVAERANRTVIEAARSMLYGRRARLSLWGEAVTTAAMLKNLVPGKN